MNLAVIRIFNLILATTLVLAGQTGLVAYIAVMHLSLEVLNRQQAYLQSGYRRFNFLFLAYELVLMERLRAFHLPATLEWLLNCAEHVSFAVVVCINLYVYLVLFGLKNQKKKAAAVALMVFTVIGLVNEVFQNQLNNRALFVLIADSVKDIYMNCIGAGIFFLTAFIKHTYAGRKANVYF